MTRLLHISDTHGCFPELQGRFDLIIHSGDILPTSMACMNSCKSGEIFFQERWLQTNANLLVEWLNGAPIIFIPGNHDFMSPASIEFILNKAGANSMNASNKLITFENINFYGFPYVPIINEMWNYERDIPEMLDEVEGLISFLNSTYIDVLITHSPLYGILDRTYSNLSVGNTVLTNSLDFKLNKDMNPVAMLCGHIHENNGISVKNGMLISNAATTQHIIEI